jgi:hypothetical protein
MQASLDAQMALVETQASYFVTALEGEPVQADLNTAIFESAKASGASAEQLAILGGALGLYSDEAMEAALQSALIQLKIDELTAAYADGETSVAMMRSELTKFIAQINEVPTQKEFTLKMITDTSQFVLPPGISEEDVTIKTGGVGLAGGADFVVPDKFKNDSFGPVYFDAGERVIAIPRDKQTTINQNMTIHTSSVDTRGESRAALQLATGGV